MNGIRTYKIKEEKAVEAPFKECFPFLKERGHVISLVGGGGKTTLMFHLASCFAGQGMKTVAMTTKKIERPDRFARTMDECRVCWAAGEYAICGEEWPGGKLRAPEEKVIAELLAEADAVVIEADGARHMAVKVPAEHEPVILPQTDIVIGVAGVHVLGGTVEEVCFRKEHVKALLGCDGTHRLTEKDLAKILLSPNGARKAVEDRTYYTVINKCDNEIWLKRGEAAARELCRKGHIQTILACLKPE